MKQLFLLCFLTFIQIASYSQKDDAQKAKSKADLFSEKAGSLVQTETTDIASIKSLDVKTIVVVDLLNNNKITAIQLEKQYSSSLGSDTKVGTLDNDEVDAVLKSLGIIKTKMQQNPPVSTHLTYESRDGIQLGCFITKGKKDWNLYLKLEKFDSNSYVFLKSDDIDELMSVLQKAKSNL